MDFGQKVSHSPDLMPLVLAECDFRTLQVLFTIPAYKELLYGELKRRFDSWKRPANLCKESCIISTIVGQIAEDVFPPLDDIPPFFSMLYSIAGLDVDGLLKKRISYMETWGSPWYYDPAWICNCMAGAGWEW